MTNRDLLLKNAVVYTVDAQDSVYSSILIRAGRIAAVGNDAEVQATAAPGTDVYNAGGKTIVPGFIDAHNHMSVAAFEPLAVDCSTPPLTSMDEVLGAIEAHCRDLPAGQWVRGIGFHSSQIEEQRNPTRYELDEVAPNTPFFLLESNCHAGYANSLALAAVGIDACTPDPWGGHIKRDGNGIPNGTLLETGANLLHSASWEAYAESDWDRAVGLLEAKAREYLAVGITGVGDACVTTRAAELYRRADAAGKLPLTLQQLHGGDHFFSQQDLRRTDIVDRIHSNESHMLRGGTMKIFVDRAYPDGPGLHQIHDGCTKHVGSNFYNPREVQDLALQATDLGINLAIHGMGNCAVDAVSDAYESVRKRTGDDAILRLEHAFIAEAAQATRLAKLGIDLVANPGLAYKDGLFFGSWRGKNQEHLRILPLRSMIDAGVRVSFASDHPCGTFSPLEIMWSAVTRRHYTGALIDPEEAVTPAEALRAYTINPAHASGRGTEEGSLEVGKRANLLVLDRNLLSISPDELRSVVVERTYVDGLLAHQRQAAQPVAAGALPS